MNKPIFSQIQQAERNPRFADGVVGWTGCSGDFKLVGGERVDGVFAGQSSRLRGSVSALTKQYFFVYIIHAVLI